MIVPYLLQQRLTVTIGDNYSGALPSELQQRLLQRLNPSLSASEISSAIVEMDANGNGIITGQELSAWFIKRELSIALLDTLSFRDPAPAKNEAAKKKDPAASKNKKRAKKKSRGKQPADGRNAGNGADGDGDGDAGDGDGDGDGFSSSVACDASGGEAVAVSSCDDGGAATAGS